EGQKGRQNLCAQATPNRQHRPSRELPMDLETLKDYRRWIGRSPEEVLRAVKTVGGWGNVFRTRLPRWASRIRNYFNETPLALKRVDDWLAGELLARLQMGLNELNRAKMTKWLKKWNVSKSLPSIKRLPDPKPGTPDPLFLDDIGETFA